MDDKNKYTVIAVVTCILLFFGKLLQYCCPPKQEREKSKNALKISCKSRYPQFLSVSMLETWH